MEEIKLSLPVYYTQEFKTKKNKTVLAGVNFYRNAYFYTQNNMKIYFSDLVRKQLKNNTIKFKKYEIEYTYYYKSAVSDLMNVVSMQSKFLNDTLQELNIIENDNVKFCKKETAIVGSQDKENPRIEITIKEYKE